MSQPDDKTEQRALGGRWSFPKEMWRGFQSWELYVSRLIKYRLRHFERAGRDVSSRSHDFMEKRGVKLSTTDQKRVSFIKRPQRVLRIVRKKKIALLATVMRSAFFLPFALFAFSVVTFILLVFFYYASLHSALARSPKFRDIKVPYNKRRRWLRGYMFLGLLSYGGPLVLLYYLNAAEPFMRLLAVVFVLAWVFYDYMEWRYDIFVITTERLWRVYGWLSTNKASIPLPNATYTQVTHPWYGKGRMNIWVFILDTNAQNDDPMGKFTPVGDGDELQDYVNRTRLTCLSNGFEISPDVDTRDM